MAHAPTLAPRARDACTRKRWIRSGLLLQDSPIELWGELRNLNSSLFNFNTFVLQPTVRTNINVQNIEKTIFRRGGILFNRNYFSTNTVQSRIVDWPMRMALFGISFAAAMTVEFLPTERISVVLVPNTAVLDLSNSEKRTGRIVSPRIHHDHPGFPIQQKLWSMPICLVWQKDRRWIMWVGEVRYQMDKAIQLLLQGHQWPLPNEASARTARTFSFSKRTRWRYQFELWTQPHSWDIKYFPFKNVAMEHLKVYV